MKMLLANFEATCGQVFDLKAEIQYPFFFFCIIHIFLFETNLGFSAHFEAFLCHSGLILFTMDEWGYFLGAILGSLGRFGAFWSNIFASNCTFAILHGCCSWGGGCYFCESGIDPLPAEVGKNVLHLSHSGKAKPLQGALRG